MSQPQTMTTAQAIGAVYDLLGGPDHSALPPSRVCTHYWLQLDKLALLIGLSAKTIYLDRLDNIVVAHGQIEKDLGEIENFGEPLGLERVDRSSGHEAFTPVPLISDMRDKDNVGRLCAFLYRNPNDASKLTLRFNVPLAATVTLRLWFEPGAFARPGMQEQPPLPRQALSVLIAETAFACLPHLSKTYAPNVYTAFRDSVAAQKLEFRQIFDKWRMTDTGTGVKYRKAFNECRRGRRGSRIILPREPL
jgi:hypothetical protein